MEEERYERERKDGKQMEELRALHLKSLMKVVVDSLK